jgi:hypothetical protein
MIPLNLKNKINKHGFMLACDTVYLNNWTKPLFFSIQKYCSWAHIHIHVFDPTPSDIVWLSSHNCSYSTENTPSEFTDWASKGLYWSVARYARVLEIYTDDTLVIDLDVDSVVVNPIPQTEFLKDLESSWVPTRLKGGQIKSLASAVGFVADRTRYILAELLMDAYKNNKLVFAADQAILNGMIGRNEIKKMDLRYTDYKFGKNGVSYIWTGKGDRVKEPKFVKMIDQYRHMK